MVGIGGAGVGLLGVGAVGARLTASDGGTALEAIGPATFTEGATFGGDVSASRLLSVGDVEASGDVQAVTIRASSDVQAAANIKATGDVQAAGSFLGTGTGGAPVFASAGGGTIPAGSSRATVVEPAMAGADAHVVVTLHGNPGSSVLRSVTKANGRFTVILTGNAASATPFSYFVFRAR